MKIRTKFALSLVGGALALAAVPGTASADTRECAWSTTPVREVCVIVDEDNVYAAVTVNGTMYGVCEDAGWHTFRPCD